MPAKTSRSWRSSQPISTASSSASCASSRSSARFSFSTLIFSTQETGSPSGVSPTGKSFAPLITVPSRHYPGLFEAAGRHTARRPAALRRRTTAFARLLLRPRPRLRKDHLADQVFEAGGSLGEFDLPARRDVFLRTARRQRHVFVAE